MRNREPRHSRTFYPRHKREGPISGPRILPQTSLEPHNSPWRYPYALT